MSAPKGNEFYKMVKGVTGRPPVYSSAQDLWLEAIKYFQWVHDNPLIEVKVFGTGLKMNVPKMRAMTERAFCLWAGMSQDTFERYKKHPPESNETNGQDFCGVTKRICDIIYQQKFEGAAGDFLNANLISRELGLVDKSQTEHSGNINLTPIVGMKFTDNEGATPSV